MDDEFDILRFCRNEEPISVVTPQYEEASWAETLSWCDNSVHPEYNDGFKAGYEDGLSDGYNGRTYGYSYDNGTTFFIYKFYADKGYPFKMATVRVNRKYVSLIFDLYGETYYTHSPGFPTLAYYKTKDISNSPNEEIFEDEDIEFYDDKTEDFTDTEFISEYPEDESVHLDADYDDYHVLGYDDGYAEGFGYGHERYLSIVNDEI